MANTENFQCPHCGSRLKKSWQMWAEGNPEKTGNYLTLGKRSESHPNCPGWGRPIDGAWILSGKFDLPEPGCLGYGCSLVFGLVMLCGLLSMISKGCH